MMKKAPPFMVCAVLPLLASCAGLVEKTGRLLDGSAFAEKTLSVYRSLPSVQGGSPSRGIELRRVRSRTQEEFLIIKPEAFPTIRLRCSAPAPDGGFSFLACEYLEASSAGWNEFSLELAGPGGKLWEQGNVVFIRLGEGAFEPVQITAGKIRYGSRRQSGNEALTSLRNRYERIAALTKWMHAYPDAPAFSGRKDFKAFWEPLLLPELSRAGRKNSLRNGTEWVRSEGIKWNARYTEALFPEELRTLRDSGALLRDWEETPFWIYFIYSWDDLERILSSELPLFKD
ncbi:MAG: hypothetical protein LBP76_08260 [Treponema sp.]|jgi:hypothetical protein|nr:hypothetical protein [Treponema sp.]